KNGECLEYLYFRTREFKDLDDYLNKLRESVNELIERCSFKVNLLGCGIGAPNASSRNGTIVNASNLVWKNTVPILDKLQEIMPMPMRIMNDASAAALGEMLFGNAKEMSDFIVITLGTGF